MTSFRPLGKINRQLQETEAYRLLKEADMGVLSTISVDNAYPYATAVNHIMLNNCIYFHSALEGHKIDNIRANDKVSFFVVHSAEIRQEDYTTNFKSVHVFGRASIVRDKDERYEVLLSMAKKYTGEFASQAKKHIDQAFDQTRIIKIDIDDIKGKYRNK